ncbi:nuclear receptor coactivator 7 isoform X1 [Scleropages formosus]|uniref:nuclear receptor coactivator 7 isoform X1 n=1 Tax=Scleropages formosus TaxID=113540 RepID=UPI000878F16F|nr:nuclear receptor coactivator 7-like isoform X1 [Scleropages formosus]
MTDCKEHTIQLRALTADRRAMEKEKKPGYFARLKRRKQIKQSQSEPLVTGQEQSEPAAASKSQPEPPMADLCRETPAGKGKVVQAPTCLDPSSVSLATGIGKERESQDESHGNSQDTRSGMKKKQPPGTVEYTVGPQDTLNKIALTFNITPNKLVQLNSLFSRYVVPGQTLFVPDTGQSESSSAVPDSAVSSCNLHSDKVSDTNSSKKEAKPLRRVLSPGSEDEEPATVKFLKMSCKYFTDGMGVVGGVMIVTPNNIMFDPHKSDPLVIENGCEEYGLICPMEEVVSIALYDDISHMKLKDALPSTFFFIYSFSVFPICSFICSLFIISSGYLISVFCVSFVFPYFHFHLLFLCYVSLPPHSFIPTLHQPSSHSDLPQDLCPLYRPGEWEDLPSEHELNPFSRFEALDRDKRPILLDDIEAVVTDTDTTKSEAMEKSPSDEGFTELELPSTGNTDESQGDIEGLEELVAPRQDSPAEWSPLEAHSGISAELDKQPEGGPVRNSVPAPTDIPAEKALGENEPRKVSSGSEGTLADTLEIKPKDLSFTSSNELTEDQQESVEPSGKDGMPRSSDEAMNETKVNVVDSEGAEPARLSEEEERKRNSEVEMKAWLLQRMQGPIEDMLLSKEEKSKNPPMFLCFKVGKPMRKSFAIGQTSSPAHQYRRKDHQPEYWFAVPQERVDHLYAFFVQWSPDVYGKDAKDQGFIVVEKDELDMVDNFFSSPTPKSWEIITVNEAKRRQSVGSFDDNELLDLLPVLSDNSLLLEESHLLKLASYLPARIQGYPWRLAYSTAVHGTSLKTLYRNLTDIDSPVLLVIKDMDNQVFGAFSTHPFRISEHCYGTGETFLYSFCPDVRVYQWSGENSYFVKGSTDSLQMGGGTGHFGLWLDADLYHGSSSTCSTFRNQPLSSKQDFTIQDLEVWTFL